MNAKSRIGQEVEDVFETLKRERDELKVQIRLANMEVRDEWDELEKQWQHLVSQKDQLKKDLEPTMDDAHTALALLKEQIGEGYKAIRNRL